MAQSRLSVWKGLKGRTLVMTMMMTTMITIIIIDSVSMRNRTSFRHPERKGTKKEKKINICTNKTSRTQGERDCGLLPKASQTQPLSSVETCVRKLWTYCKPGRGQSAECFSHKVAFLKGCTSKQGRVPGRILITSLGKAKAWWAGRGDAPSSFTWPR